MAIAGRKFSADQAGNMLIAFALCAALVIGAAGGALDYMRLAQERSALQEAADAAALAAARLYGKTEAERNATAQKIFAQNYRMSDLAAPVVTLSFDGDFVNVNVSHDVPTMLLGVIGKRSFSAAVSSQAARGVSAPVCLLALDETSPNSIEIYGNAGLTASNCAAVSNSADDQGLRTYGGATAEASEFAVVGGFDGTFSPTPISGINPLADPYAAKTLPAPGACIDASDRLMQANFTLDPGTYCGGIEIMAGATALFNPGIYIMKDGPFEMQSGAVATAENVTLAFTGPTATLYLQGGAQVRLTAPAEGDFAGLALFSESIAPNVEQFTISGGATLDLEGGMYLPTHEIWLKSPTTDRAVLTAATSDYGLVAKRFWVQGAADLEVTHVNPDSLENTLRLKSGVRLVR
jgi:hypothetical protein